MSLASPSSTKGLVRGIKLYNPLKEQNFQNSISTFEMAFLIDDFEL
jgi:hypothetical protein